MTDEILRKMIAALRDTAEKATETTSREVKRRSSNTFDYETEIATLIEDRYDRSWIAGRLLGIADVAEAMIAKGEG